MLKYAHSSVDIGNHIYTNVQNCILLKYKCDKKCTNFCPPPQLTISKTFLWPWIVTCSQQVVRNQWLVVHGFIAVVYGCVMISSIDRP